MDYTKCGLSVSKFEPDLYHNSQGNFATMPRMYVWFSGSATTALPEGKCRNTGRRLFKYVRSVYVYSPRHTSISGMWECSSYQRLLSREKLEINLITFVLYKY